MTMVYYGLEQTKVFIVMMVLFVNVCCSGHRNSKRFLIGNSLEQKLTVEEMLELYLQALCANN